MKKLLSLLLLASTTFIISCEDGIDGINTLIKKTTEQSSLNCENGGLKIETGFDENRNDILDENEVNTTDYICNGIGFNSLINTVTEPSGSVCENGGIKIEIGIDENQNNILDENEITKNEYICNGQNGLGYQETRLFFYQGYPSGGNFLETMSSKDKLKLGELIRFDKRNWGEATSIKFNSMVSSSGNSSNKVILELYNDTDNILINALTSNNPEFEIIESINVIDNLPEKEITLSLYIRSESGSQISFRGKSELIIEK